MKTISKRISAVLLSVYMVFGVVSTDYLTVQAFEWVVPSLTVGESLLWLMGLLGMTYTEGATAWRDVAPEYEQDFIDYANEHGMTYEQTNSWLNDTASGKLNQLSNVWSTFKDWVKSLVSTDSVGGINSIIKDFIPSVHGLNDYSDFAFDGAYYTVSSSSGDLLGYFCFFNGYDLTVSNNGQIFNFNAKDESNCRLLTLNINTSSGAIYFQSVSTPANFSFSWANGDRNYYLYGYDIPTSAVAHVFPWTISGVNDYSYFDSYNPALIPDISFADSNTEDASISGVIDLPWGNLGDDEEERDKTYDDLVGGLDLGQEIGDLWQALQDLMGVLAVDDAGVLQPNDGGENPPTLEDEVENNKVNGAFVLTGLQKVFPFCIPFDLYAFITLLEAPPVAPVIQYPIYNPVTDSNEIITIDFSTWESVVILFRYIFDFLFIIGLLLMARALIGGGDSA